MKIRLSLKDVKEQFEFQNGIIQYYEDEGDKKEIRLVKAAWKKVKCVDSLIKFVSEFYPYHDSGYMSDELAAETMVTDFLTSLSGTKPTFELI